MPPKTRTNLTGEGEVRDARTLVRRMLRRPRVGVPPFDDDPPPAELRLVTFRADEGADEVEVVIALGRELLMDEATEKRNETFLEQV